MSNLEGDSCLSWTELTTWYLCIILCKINSIVRDSASPLQLTDATVGRC